MTRLPRSLAACWLCCASPAAGVDIPIADAAALSAAAKTAAPGDRLLLRAGEWRDAELTFVGRGTAEAPLVLAAAVPGKTILTGKSSLRIGGEHLQIEGIRFDDPDPSAGDLIEFRAGSKQVARHCRLTDCAVRNTRPAVAAAESRWVGVYGTENRVDRCVFEGKTGKGATFVVWLGEGHGGRHVVSYNYFGPRERLGKNGGETIRIGDSKTSLLTGGCLVEKNLFEKCNGEAECISNKSCGNIYRENTFLEVGGTLTLRHGNGCLVENNVFLGRGTKGTGGIRIIGEDHIVRGNYLEKLTGDDARSAICLMQGIPNSPANRYFQVKRARVENNVVSDCEHSVLIGLADDKLAVLPPVDTVFSGNRISAPRRTVIEARCALDGIVWKDNRFTGEKLGIPLPEGIAWGEAEIIRKKPLARADIGTSW